MTEKIWTVTLDFDVERKHIVAVFNNKEKAESIFFEVTKNLGKPVVLSVKEWCGRIYSIRCDRLLCASMHESNK